MYKKRYKKFTMWVVICLIVSLFQISTTSILTSVQGKESQTIYEIYPKPHQITYQEDSFVIRKEVNIVYDDTIDDVTKERLMEVLSTKDKTVSISDSMEEGKTNILVGTYQSNAFTSNYITDNYNFDNQLFEKKDSYLMTTNNGEICILGKDTNAVFYGVTSLKHIFNQMDGSTIRGFVIEDYADTSTRGFIEGYYGIPWTNEDRKSLMKFGGDFKMTSYIFAPKNDLYHTSKWRELYPANELQEIQEMVQVGNRVKCRFVWTAHPFMGGFDTNDYDNEMVKLKAKYEQLYSVGVRQFGILGDDVGGLDKQIVVKMMKELSDWGKGKGDVYDFVFCPEGYNSSWTNFQELNIYDPHFPEDIQIFWTGESVCSSVSQTTLTKFRTQNLGEGMNQRRSPLFWLNWPVNDINMQRLLMGKGELLQTDINPEDLGGVVTNPMQDAEPSKVAIFAIADYSWNVKGFNADKSWNDSFEYIDTRAGEALHTLAKHMSDPMPNGHNLSLGESEELAPLLDAFKKNLTEGTSIVEIGKQLLGEFDKIIDACDIFISTSNNERMVEQITPFAKSLKDLMRANALYVKAAISVELEDTSGALENFTDATIAYEASKNHNRPTLGGSTKAQPGTKRLLPFMESIRDTISPEMNEIVGNNRLNISVKTNISSIYEGKLENVLDGKSETFVWFGVYEEVGQYVQLNLNKPMTLYGLSILNGTPGKPGDTFAKGKVQYTTDGTSWLDMVPQEYDNYPVNINIKDVEIENVVGVRYICTGVSSSKKWSAMREFTLHTTKEKEAQLVDSEVIRTQDEWQIYSGAESNLFDDDENSAVWYASRSTNDYTENKDATIPGHYLGVKLSEPILLGNIEILGGPTPTSGDYFHDAILEYSLDGINYTPIQAIKNQRDVNLDVASKNIHAQYVRLRNTVVQKNWVGYRAFKVTPKYFTGYAYTNVNRLKEQDADYRLDNACLYPASNVTLDTGEYIGLKLDRIHELTYIVNTVSSKDITLEIAKNPYEWEGVSAGELSPTVNARYIRLINKTSAPITFDITELSIQSLEYYPPFVKESTLGNAYVGSNDNLFDKDRSTGVNYDQAQKAGNYMIIDIGQMIDMNSLKLVLYDSSTDYIRDGLVYVSKDGMDWGEAIITIGDQLPNTEQSDDKIMESYPDHEVSYNTISAKNMNTRVRYIKIEITQDYLHRWTYFNEIEINDGEYIPFVNDPTYETAIADTYNGYYHYMKDDDITTMFTPSEKNGSLIYHVSENNEENQIQIIQNSKTMSNASVRARVIKPDQFTASWVDMRTLNQSMSQFVLPKGTKILDIEMAWGDVIPQIAELRTLSSEQTEPTKEALKKLLEETIDTSDWTTSSKDAYVFAKKTGKEIYDNNLAAQASVDAAVNAINRAKNDKEIKGDISLLQKRIDNAISKEDNYTAKSWVVYNKAIDAAKKALEDSDNVSQTMMEALIKNIEDTEHALVFNPNPREQAEIAMEDIQSFIEKIEEPKKIYTEKSWQALLNAERTIHDLLELNKTTPQNPERFKEAHDTLNSARNLLVNISSLIPYIEEFEAMSNPSIYTKQTYETYKKEIGIAKTMLIDTKELDIHPQIINIQKAKEGLYFQGIIDVQEYTRELKELNSVNYTTKSYKHMMDEVTEVEKVDIEQATPDELKALGNRLLVVKNALVNISSLKTEIKIAESLDAGKYTISSYKELITSVKNAKGLYEEGTSTQVQQAIKDIDQAIKQLKIKVNKEELQKYLNAIVPIDNKKYTKESLDNYYHAKDILLKMLENTEDISAIDFINAKEGFERARESLEERTMVSTTLKGNTTNTSDITETMIPSLLIMLSLIGGIYTLYSKRKRKPEL